MHFHDWTPWRRVESLGIHVKWRRVCRHCNEAQDTTTFACDDE